MGKRITLQINEEVRAKTKDIQVNDPNEPFGEVYNAYDGVKNPSPNAKTALSKDINRMTHVYVPGKNGKFKDVIKKIRLRANELNTEAKNPAKNAAAKKDLIAEFLTNGNLERKDRLEGLCQDVSNSAISGFLKNFKLKVGDQEKNYIVAKGIESQNLAQKNNNEFRLDYNSLIYIYVTDDGPYYRDKSGQIRECSMEVLQQFSGGGGRGKTSKINRAPDGMATITWEDEEGTTHVLECLPLLNVNVSANLKFDKKNESTVNLNYDVETFTPEIVYKGPSNPAEAPGLLKVEEVQNIKSSLVAHQENFPGLNSKQNKKAMELMREIISRYVAQGQPHTQENKNFQKFIDQNNAILSNKGGLTSPREEMLIYGEFFKLLKAQFAPIGGFAGFFSGGKNEYRTRVLSHINEWEKIIFSCKPKYRLFMLEKMEENILSLTPKSWAERAAQIFSPKYSFKLDLESLEKEAARALVAEREKDQLNKKFVEPVPTSRKNTSFMSEKDISTDDFKKNVEQLQIDLKKKYEHDINAKKMRIELLSIDNEPRIQVELNYAKKEVINHFQNTVFRAETTMNRDPSYKAIGILFDLNVQYPVLQMETSNDPVTLIKIYKAAKFTKRNIEFSPEDQLILGKLPEYGIIHELSKNDFVEYLKNKGEYETLADAFESKPRENLKENLKAKLIAGGGKRFWETSDRGSSDKRPEERLEARPDEKLDARPDPKPAAKPVGPTKKDKF